MMQVLPLTLLGSNLGERHRYLNTCINNAYQQNVPLQSILELPEKCPIDRVFKIELSSKYRDVDFIVENLKENDMLYVSKALRCLWLLEPEYSHIVNPVHLESHLYPGMLSTAVNKMKKVIELHLRDPKRCQEFYEYYSSNINVAIKFLLHCSKDFISHEFLLIINKLKSKYLGVLCEVCPQAAKLYFEGLKSNEAAFCSYVKSPRKYWNSILSIVKLDGILFLDLLEKYYTVSTRLSSSVTKYIMKNYKKRYLMKPELYAAHLLDVKTLASYLTEEEIKDVVMRLARAKYLKKSFTYKDAEPFLKRLNAVERGLVKKQFFVDKNIGTVITNWPYPPPEQVRLIESNETPLEDLEHDPYEYVVFSNDLPCGICSISTKCKKDFSGSVLRSERFGNSNSSLDQLFERYRFVNFERTFFEFRKLLLTEGTIEGRRNMMLVLVSKSGGNEAKLEEFLKFLVERHSNEPGNLRDAIARSMVKRAFVWRLSSATWGLLLKWATTSVSEILHTKVLRHLLDDTTCPSADVAAYLNEFCDFTTYGLSPTEKDCVAKRLPTFLISAKAADKLLDTLKAYKLRVGSVVGAEDYLVSAARTDEEILRRLFKTRVARKQLIKELFQVTQDDAAYMNALKHDISLLANGESFVAFISKNKPKHDRFLRALVLYFSERSGLAAQHRAAIARAIEEDCRESFARPLAFLFNVGHESFQNCIGKVEVKTLKGDRRKFAIALRANAAVVRPILDVNVVSWHAIGAKFIGNKLLVCSDRDLEANISKCLSWKKTMRVALRLAVRIGLTTDMFAAVVEARPMVVLKVVLSDIRKGTVDPELWHLAKPVMLNLDLSKNTLRYLKRSLRNLRIKSNVDADYWVTVYCVFRKISEGEAMPMLCKIENLLTKVDENTLMEILTELLRETFDKSVTVIQREYFGLTLYFRVIAKYLLTSQSVQIQKDKMETVCDPFFNNIEVLWRETKHKTIIDSCLDEFLISLKYSKAFIDTEYVSCVPMFERILERLGKILPREENFTKYVCIHATMLYCRAIRQARVQDPGLFEGPVLIHEDGVKLIGFLLGKYIGMEIHTLVQSYYQSIIDIYQAGVQLFFSNNFDDPKDRVQLMTSMVQGLMDSGVEAQFLAMHIFETERYQIAPSAMKEILELLKGSEHAEIKFFLYENIYRY